MKKGICVFFTKILCEHAKWDIFVVFLSICLFSFSWLYSHFSSLYPDREALISWLLQILCVFQLGSVLSNNAILLSVPGQQLDVILPFGFAINGMMGVIAQFNPGGDLYSHIPRLIGGTTLICCVTKPFRLSVTGGGPTGTDTIEVPPKFSFILSTFASILYPAVGCMLTVLFLYEMEFWKGPVATVILSFLRSNIEIVLLFLHLASFIYLYYYRGPYHGIRKMMVVASVIQILDQFSRLIHSDGYKIIVSYFLSFLVHFLISIGLIYEIFILHETQLLAMEDLKNNYRRVAAVSPSSDHHNKESSEIIREKYKKLEQKIIKKDDILDKLSIEMRNLVSATMGSLELLLDSKLGKQEREYVFSLEKSINALTNLVENAQEYTSADSGRVVLDVTQSFNLEEMLDGLLEDKLVRGKEDVEVSYEIHNGLPEVFVGDSKILRRILSHLLHNAVKFTQRGEVHIAAECLRKKKEVITLQVQVSDTGSGIPDKFLKYMFTPFYTLRETGCGTGLGLAICDRLVHLLSNGKVTIDSKLDHGTTVTLRCNFREGNGFSGTPEDEEMKEQLSFISVILLISRQKKIAQTIPQMLHRRGIKNVAVVDTITAAKELLGQSEGFQIVLVDFRVVNGAGETFECLETSNELRQFKEDVVTLIMGTEEQKETTPLEIKSRFLTKPIRYQSMIGTIKKVVRGISPSIQLLPTPETTRSLKGILNNMKVLIAEDNEMMRSVLQKLITGMGPTCTVTANGLECLQAFTKDSKSYDLIIMDCEMPVMTGFRSSIKIREYEKQNNLKSIPIIALTATKSESIHQNCLSLGMDDCIIKPVNRQTLSEIFGKYNKRKNIPLTNSLTLSSTSKITRRPCILLVEDNKMIAKITQTVLESKYRVKHAIHGQEALTMVVANYWEYDLILMDIMMPVMDGITSTQKIRQFEKDRGLEEKPIIALTANPMPGHKNECKAAGCTDYARKPIDYPSLQDIVAKYSSNHSPNPSS